MVKNGAEIQSFQACTVNHSTILLLWMRERAFSGKSALSGAFKVWGEIEVDIVYLLAHLTAAD